MGLALTLVIVVALVLIVRSMAYSGGAPTQQPSEPSATGESPNHAALEIMQDVLDACSHDHSDAVSVLIFMAASDGKVSRQELRIIIGFCTRMGTVVHADWEGAAEFLNAGISFNVTGSVAGSTKNIEAIALKPPRYRAAFLGAAEAIVASNKTSNTAKRELLGKARELI